MNISFDLDSTLIPNGKEFETENRNGIAKLFGIEEIRKGTSELVSDLQNQGHKIHIYTTSFRSKIKIRQTLRYYGIKVSRIVNEKENRQILRSKNINSSKFPPAFDFDLHIDDLKGVEIESEKFNFKVIIIEPTDNNWAEKIKNGIKTLGNNVYNSLLLIFLSENPRAELLPVIFTKLVAKPTQRNHTQYRYHTFEKIVTN